MKYTPILNLTIDTREQKPLTFNAPYVKNITKSKLNFGDYSCSVNVGKEEFIIPVYFERKGIGDLFSTIGGQIKRFKKEIERSMDSKCMLMILIEDSYSNMIKGYEHSSVAGISIARTLFTLMTKYKVPFCNFNNREEMSHWISEYYYSCAKRYIKGRENER